MKSRWMVSKGKSAWLSSLSSSLIIVSCFPNIVDSPALASEGVRTMPMPLKSDDVIATGNEWIALPTIRASDGALVDFNVLSMRDRGLLEVVGAPGEAVLTPFVQINGKNIVLHNLRWELIEYWIPVAHFKEDGVEITLTYCAPPESRAAFLRLTVKNDKGESIPAVLGLKASWGGLNRVTYNPVQLRGDRRMAPAPWVDPAEVFSFVTHDTWFAWSLIYPNSEARGSDSPESSAPTLEARRELKIAPGQTAECNYILGAGIEEFSGPHNAKALREMIDRNGADYMIRKTAEWCQKHTRTTGQADLDFIMNRNFLFTTLYAWGKAIDTEQLVGVTSRSPRYYVSAAYWDRDAMLWSFPGLLDTDTKIARQALEYALGVQLRNAGVHSRFIDGVVLEDGLELDELVAPLHALGQYVERTNDDAFLLKHKEALLTLDERLMDLKDEQTGLYSTLQDAQDEYQPLPFSTYDNVLTWRVLQDMSKLYERLGDKARAQSAENNASALKVAIQKFCIADGAHGAHGAGGPIYADATDGKKYKFADVPPGSLMKLPLLGFVPENDPVFARTYDWLHSKNHEFSYSDKPFGIPGSYRLPFSTSWSVADHLQLTKGREQALKILRGSSWDAGIISEGVDPENGVMDHAGRAFATAAGYVAHSIYQAFGKDQAHSK